MLDMATKTLKTGVFCKPSWYDAVSRVPPETKWQHPTPPELFFPEDKLYKKLIKERPILELEVEDQEVEKNTVAHRWARTQADLMEKEEMDEKMAYRRCEELFEDEVADLIKDLDFVRESRGASLRTVSRNVGFSVKTSKALGQILESKLNKKLQNTIVENPLTSKLDTPLRRRAKLDRLALDPAVDAIYRMLSPREATVVTSIRQLIIYPEHAEVAFFNATIKKYFLALREPLHEEFEAAMLKEYSKSSGATEDEHKLGREVHAGIEDEAYENWDDVDLDDLVSQAAPMAPEAHVQEIVQPLAKANGDEETLYEGKTRDKCIQDMQKSFDSLARYWRVRFNKQGTELTQGVQFDGLKSEEKTALINLVYYAELFRLVPREKIQTPKPPLSGPNVFNDKLFEAQKQLNKFEGEDKTMQEIWKKNYQLYHEYTWYKNNAPLRKETQKFLATIKARGLNKVLMKTNSKGSETVDMSR